MKAARKWAVVQFPGSNCDQDALKVLDSLPQIEASYHWYEEPIKKNEYEVVILPGGFSFGDYLRAGAIAKLSAAVQSLPEAIEEGLHVFGICNGFQILLENRLLPGYLQVNQSLRFISDLVELEIKEEAFPWFNKQDIGQRLRIPIAHRFGNYQPLPVDSGEIHPVVQYVQNPNGSFKNIAGIYRRLGKGSLLGMMPHPERASFEAIGLNDGQLLWQNAWENLK